MARVTWASPVERRREAGGADPRAPRCTAGESQLGQRAPTLWSAHTGTRTSERTQRGCARIPKEPSGINEAAAQRAGSACVGSSVGRPASPGHGSDHRNVTGRAGAGGTARWTVENRAPEGVTRREIPGGHLGGSCRGTPRALLTLPKDGSVLPRRLCSDPCGQASPGGNHLRALAHETVGSLA